MRLARTRACAAAIVLAALGLTSLTTVGTPAGAQTPADGTRYAVTEPLCSAPSDPTMMRCYGIKRVPVAKGTRNAQAYKPHASRGPAGGYTPKALAAAYGYNPAANRSSLTVGIVLWHDAPNVLSDLNHFNAHYGLPRETSRSFRKVNERGAASPLPQRDRGAAGEIALDTQAVRSVCHTCRILLVEADDAYDRNLAAAVNTAVRLGADIVTNSYGTPERHFSAAMQAAYRHPGVAMIASTGDDGWYGWDYTNDPSDYPDEAPSFPATSPYVIAVGGTTLQLDSANHRVSETVWNDNGDHAADGMDAGQGLGASGGGCSKYFPAPSWQTHTPGWSKTGCGTKRLAADVALVADPSTGFDVYDSYGSFGWVTIGGTSLSSPLAAGMYALAGGPRGARYPATALYGNASAHPSTRFDVTVGGNAFCGNDTTAECADAVRATQLPGGTPNPNFLGLGLVDCSFSRKNPDAVPTYRRSQCTAVKGFDGPTGVGTPRSTRLFVKTDPSVTIANSAATHGRVTAFRARVVEPLAGTKITKLSWTWGDGRTSSTTSTSITHRFAKKGRYTVYVTVQDSRHQLVVARRTVTVR